MQVFNKNFNKLLSQFINGDVYENSLVSERYTPVLDVLEKDPISIKNPVKSGSIRDHLMILQLEFIVIQ
jgi:hypothetical protein